MLALALTLFAAMQALMETRIGRPLGSVPQGDAAGIAAADIVTTGIRASLSFANKGLQMHRRADTARALDAAMRASEVAQDALSGTSAGTAFDRVHRAVMQGRLALQNDQKSEVARHIEAAIEAVPQQLAMDVPPPPNLQEYLGATVINAEGIRVGEVARVQDTELVISVGGHRNVFGFIDIGGEQLTIGPGRLLFGRKKRFGDTFVSLPTLVASPRQLAFSASR